MLDVIDFQSVLFLLPEHFADLLLEFKERSTFTPNSPRPHSECWVDEQKASMKSSFHRIALNHLDELFGYAMTLTRSQPEAEDLVQETYLRATRAFDKLAPDSHIKGWLYTILRNLFLNQTRHHRAGPPLIDMEDETGAPLPLADKKAVDPLTSYLTDEKQRDVRQAIESLPDSFREVIILREFEEMSYQEIAEVLHCPVGTVMSRLGRARDKLRQTLQHWGEEKTA